MNFKAYEDQLCQSLDDVFSDIIQSNISLDIRAKSRVGAEISDYLEEKFTEYINGKGHHLLSDAEKSPKGATKNPYDAKCYFEYMGRKELIWIDIKAFKISSKNSNPDIGSINKVIKFISEGNFYLVFVLVYYDEEGDGLKFVKNNGKYTKVYLLKDVNHTVRLNPKNQLQVNMSAPPEYRTREEFIKLLKQKHVEYLHRTMSNLKKQFEKIDDVYNNLLESNKISERRKN